MLNRFLLIVTLMLSVSLSAQMKEKDLDLLIQNTLKTFDVPGISVGIVKEGKTIYAKGFGVRSLTNQLPMNEQTLVGIASNSKAFTCVALAMLVDEGKITWDDKVSQHIPEFRMHDPYVSQNITIKDLVTHRSGLGLGQGDLMFFPEGGTLTVQDIITNVRFLKPQLAFRSTFRYNNIMYIIAGEVIKRASGISWDEFIETRIMKPVGMNASFASYNRAIKTNPSNIIDAHAPADGKVIAVPHDWNETANAAGGIMSNITDMLTWAQFLNNGFVTKGGTKLLSDRQIQQLWQIQQPNSISSNNPYDTKFSGYGLGWFISDVKGQQQIMHTGGLIGTVTQFTLLPSQKLGIVVLTNQQSGDAFSTITNTIKDSYLGIKDRNWLKNYSEKAEKAAKTFHQQKKDVYGVTEAFGKTPHLHAKPEQFLGSYKDAWFGTVELTKNGREIRILCTSSPRLKGQLLPYSYNTYVVKWDDRSYDADAFIIFDFDEKGKASRATLKPISEITDFSFDFEDLDLIRIK